MTEMDELERLRRDNRLLEKKLRRSEINRARLELFKENSNRLFRGVIEEQNETQRRLVESERRAQEANRAKSAFLANMSHELRTPLNAIIGYTELLKEEGDNLRDEQLEDLDTVLTASNHLLKLISSVLDLSKIEAERLDLVLEDVPLPDVITEVVGTARPVIEGAGNQFVVDCQCGGVVFETDRMRLTQILLNLLSNAGKFCNGGEVRLVTRPEPDRVTFAVEDTGIGMTEEQLEKVFEPFVQADASTTRRYGGTGLGLSVARSLAELLGGTITASSNEGRGARFVLSLPRGRALPQGVQASAVSIEAR